MNAESMDCLKMAEAVQAGKQSARDLATQALERAKKFQEKFHAFTRLTPELAQKQAEQVEARIRAGEKLPLAGVPFAVKDLIDVQGLPTTAGSRVFAENTAKADATVVRRLTAAGAVLLGKLNLDECAFRFTGQNQTFGDCKNPWNPARIAGGSSSGSAVAVSLDICPFTLGSDAGGSVRLPAALCGLVGLKSTYGRVSRSGGIPLAWSLDHVGTLTHTAAEAALVLQVMAGKDPLDESSSRRPVPDYPEELKKPVRGLRLGIPHTWFYESLQPEVAEAVTAALDRLAGLGCRRVDVTLPYLKEALGAHRAIIFAEASSFHEPFLRDRADRYEPDIRAMLQGGLFLPAVDYLKAQRARRLIRQAWHKVFQSVDCLVTPASPLTATPFGQEKAALPGGEKPLVRAFLDLSLPFNVTGHPAVSVPCGFSKEQLPIGLQIVGRPFEEATILRLAHHYQQGTDWHRRRPAVQ